jgi:Ca-activated chloride channel family protein
MASESGQALRLETAKKVFAEFVRGNGADLPGRENDLIGMVVFARFAETVCPLTLAHDILDHFLDRVRLVSRRDEDGTAIGDAIALAAARLKTAEEHLGQTGERNNGEYEITGKVIILLTDGENNRGDYTPEAAARLAREWGIKIYAIGVGGDEAAALPAIFRGRPLMAGNSGDWETLEKIAEITGGRFWLAEDGESLRAVYEEINRLEKSEFESVRYVNYRERFAPFALAAVVLLLLEALLHQTVLRRIP